MARKIYYTKLVAENELDTTDFGKVYYEFTIRPFQEMSSETADMFKQDLEDFEMYLMQKYVASTQEVDTFPVWKRLRMAIKNLM